MLSEDRLPAHLEEKLLRDPGLCTIQQETRTSKHNASRQRYTNLLKKMKVAALRQYQQNWVRERRDWKILTRGKDAAHDKSRTDYVRDMCLLIPERGRLAEQMSADDHLEPAKMWLALQDLQSLCSQDFTVLYLPGSRPVDGACPIKCCQIPLDGSVLHCPPNKSSVLSADVLQFTQVATKPPHPVLYTVGPSTSSEPAAVQHSLLLSVFRLGCWGRVGAALCFTPGRDDHQAVWYYRVLPYVGTPRLLPILSE